MNKLFVCFAMLFLSFEMYGQPMLPIISKSLANNKLSEFNATSTPYYKSKFPGFEFGLTKSRTLLGNYTELMYMLPNRIDENYPLGQIDVCIISLDDNIIYYKISSNDSIIEHKKATNLKSFELAYKKAYGVIPNLVDIGQNIIFAKYCGDNGEVTDEWKTISEAIKNGNTKIVLDWLQSVNVEKQLFALTVLENQIKAGKKISPLEIRIIKEIMKKEGDIITCYGCSIEREKIATIISKEFKLLHQIIK